MWFNPIMIWLLRSPLHFFVSGNTMLLQFKGKKSGRDYAVPVNYLRQGERLLTTSQRQRTWWRNLRGGVQVAVRLKGQQLHGTAAVVEETSEVAFLLMEYLTAAPKLAGYYQVELDSEGLPSASDVSTAAMDKVMIVTQLAG